MHLLSFLFLAIYTVARPSGFELGEGGWGLEPLPRMVLICGGFLVSWDLDKAEPWNRFALLPCASLSGPNTLYPTALQVLQRPPSLWVPSKFFLPLAHLNQNSLSLSPQLIRSDYLIKRIRTEVWMRLNPPWSICILKEESVNPNASTISRMGGEVWGAWGFPVLPHPLPRSSQAWVTYDSLHQELEILESALQGPASVPHPSALGG